MPRSLGRRRDDGCRRSLPAPRRVGWRSGGRVASRCARPRSEVRAAASPPPDPGPQPPRAARLANRGGKIRFSRARSPRGSCSRDDVHHSRVRRQASAQVFGAFVLRVGEILTVEAGADGERHVRLLAGEDPILQSVARGIVRRRKTGSSHIHIGSLRGPEHVHRCLAPGGCDLGPSGERGRQLLAIPYPQIVRAGVDTAAVGLPLPPCLRRCNRKRYEQCEGEGMRPPRQGTRVEEPIPLPRLAIS